MWRYRLQDRFGDVDLVPQRWVESRDKPRTAIPSQEDIMTWMVGDADYYVIIDAIRACDVALPNLWALNPEQVDAWVFRTLKQLFTQGDLAVVDVEWPKPPPGIVKKPKEERPEEEVKPTSWIGIRVEDEAGEPVAGARYRMLAGDGRVLEGATDKFGMARYDGIDPDECEITFPKSDWKLG